MTTLVVVVVLVMSTWHMVTVTRLRLQEAQSVAQLLADAMFQRVFDVTNAGPPEPYSAIQQDDGLKAIINTGLGSAPAVRYVLYTTVVGPDGKAVIHSTSALIGTEVHELGDFGALVDGGTWAQLDAVWHERRFEVREPILAGDKPFGAIRVGVSTLLVANEIKTVLRRAASTALVALVLSTFVATLLANWMLRPIHVIQSGLSRLGRGELDVALDLPGEEFRDLGTSFEAISAQLSAVRTQELPASATDFASVMDNLEDAMALFSPEGDLMFANSSMRGVLPSLVAASQGSGPAVAQLPPDNPVRQLIERSLAGRRSLGPVSMALGAHVDADPEPAERLLMCHAIEDTNGRFLGVMLVARNLGFLSHVHSTLNYSRKLAALGRLMAGVAHEVKNPLNAMTIHLELLKQKLSVIPQPIVVPDGSGGTRQVGPAKHVVVIADAIRRLDHVVVGFLKFARPEELRLQPVQLASIISEVVSMSAPEAEQRGVTVRAECSASLPEINADPGMLQQAVLNLALNACQAMPNGGTLRLACRTASHRRVEIDVEDTGVGIPPENLGKIFDLYFTTKDTGTGIGLSMVYRIVQLHDGEVEVESTPGHGTRFRLVFPQA
ncbi:MAG TPA: ATP-binding protein [Gemmatimonadales bacterium]|nr:ATP-binding protein [Gemmatimonadales bacterium]